jgi:calcineurin-like phosphoesterase family protein
MITLQSENLWFTSDTHYAHKNICRGVSNWEPSDATRDFETLEDMNNALVERINERVKPDDWLIHLGDWSFGGQERIAEFREKILCKNIVLILGNHDHHIVNNKHGERSLFKHVAHYEELRLRDSKGKITSHFVLCHYPIISWNDMRKGSIMLHGHQHLKRESRFGEGKRMDIGACGNDLYPYHIEEILAIMNERESHEI